MSKVVLKFGGTSVLNAQENMKKIINDATNNYDKVFIVYSALSGVTKQLLKLLNYKTKRESLIDIEQIIDLHKDFINNNLVNMRKQANINLEYYTNKLIEVVTRYYTIPLTLKKKKGIIYRDLIYCFGEKMSVCINHFILKEMDIISCILNVESIIKTDSNYGECYPIYKLVESNIKEFVVPIIKNYNVFIMCGFIGSDLDNNLTTLGRSGSDFTATIMGKYLGVDAIYIYTDVDGILTADPKKVASANIIDNLTIHELAELSYFGENVLHSKTLIPIENSDIQFKICNTFNLDSDGTTIVHKRINKDSITAITSNNDNILVTIQGLGMIGSKGLLAKVFGALEKENIIFISQASSKQSICFTVKSGVDIKNILDMALEKDKKEEKIKSIIINKDISIISIIGENIINNVGIAGSIFKLLGDNNINIKAISQGSCEISINFIVDSKYEIAALNIIHSLIENH